MANICVFCSSSNGLDEAYVKAAEKLGEIIGKGRHNLIYGGSKLGLMGVLSSSVKSNGGRVIGIIPEHLQKVAEGEDELIKARNMHHRKELMETKSDVFVALPGGIGTIDEIFEILVGIQLKIHSKPMTVININNYYDDLIKQLKKVGKEGFGKLDFDIVDVNKLLHISETPQEAMEYVLSKVRDI